MPDFVEFEPHRGVQDSGGRGHQAIFRAADMQDVRGLATVMAARGGTAPDLAEHALRLVGQLPVLLVAETPVGCLVGWSGAQSHVILPGTNSGWLVAGLTVLPAVRRQGVGSRLLAAVVRAVHALDPGAPIHSAVNVLNQASIELHHRVGFRGIARGGAFAGIDFTGGEGVLMRCHGERVSVPVVTAVPAAHDRVRSGTLPPTLSPCRDQRLLVTVLSCPVSN